MCIWDHAGVSGCVPFRWDAVDSLCFGDGVELHGGAAHGVPAFEYIPEGGHHGHADLVFRRGFDLPEAVEF